MTHFVTSLPHPHGHGYMVKKIFLLIEGNTFLFTGFPFTSKLKSNCLFLLKLEATKILLISRSHKGNWEKYSW